MKLELQTDMNLPIIIQNIVQCHIFKKGGAHEYVCQARVRLLRIVVLLTFNW